MTTASDFTDATPGKEHSRLDTLDLVRQHSRRLWNRKDQCLRLDWVELSGTLAPTLRLLLNSNALRPEAGRFIGVDTERHVIQGCEQHYAAEITSGMAEWRQGDLNTLLRDRAAFENTGVLVYDSFDGAHGRKMEDLVRHILEFSRDQAERQREFLLVLNLVAQRTTDFTAYTNLIRSFVPDADVSPENGFVTTYKGRKGTKMLLARIRFGF
jgi:hypothetical protein